MKNLISKGSLYVKTNVNLIFALVFFFILTLMQRKYFFESLETLAISFFIALTWLIWISSGKTERSNEMGICPYCKLNYLSKKNPDDDNCQRYKCTNLKCPEVVIS